VTGTGSSVPDPSIDSVSFMGAISPDSFVLNYTVFFTGSGTADGVLTLKK
jgi:hypothetical protein